MNEEKDNKESFSLRNTSPAVKFLILFVTVLCVASIFAPSRRHERVKETGSLSLMEENVQQSAKGVIDITEKWFRMEISDTDMLEGLPDRVAQLGQVIGQIKHDSRQREGEAKHCRLLKLAYSALVRNLAAYHCARSRLYSPDKDGGGACAPYTFDDTKAEITALMKAVDIELEPAGADRPEKPGIILIVIDTLRADYFRAPGSAPFMRQLADEGLEFTDVISCGSATHTSVASLLTGTNPLVHGMIDYESWDNSLLFTPLFEKKGYQTAAFSANSVVTPDMGFGKGFQAFVERYWVPADVLNLDIASYLFADMIPSKPQFIYIHYIDPHGPYFSPDKFNPNTGKTASWPGAVIPQFVRNEFNKKGIDARTVVTDAQLAAMKSNYHDEIKYMDARLKDIFSVMEETGVLDNALVVITSDHGEEFLEHGGVKHSHTVYGEAIRVPLVLWGDIPGEWRDAHDPDRPVSLLDLAPTLLDFAGIPAPEHIEGTHLFDPDQPEFRASITNGRTPGSFTESCKVGAVIRDNWKLVTCPSRKTHRLFDLSADPGEREDVSAAHPDIVQALGEDLVSLEPAMEKTPREAEILTPEKLKQLKSLGYVE